MVVHHNVLDIGQAPSCRGKIERDPFLFAGEADDRVETADRKEGVVADHGRAGHESEQRQAR